MRESMEYFMIDFDKDDYEGLPENLREFNYYNEYEGHVIMAIPAALEETAKESDEPYKYEGAIPCKYVLSHDYRITKIGAELYVICDVDYDEMHGISYDESYREM